MTSYGSYLLQTILSLLVVAALCVVVLLLLRRAGVASKLGPIALCGRLPLDGHRTIYLVRVGAQVLVVGAGDGGLVKLGEVPFAELGEVPPEEKGSFQSVLARLTQKRGA